MKSIFVQFSKFVNSTFYSLVFNCHRHWQYTLNYTVRFLQISPQPTRQLFPTKETIELLEIAVEFLSSGTLRSQAVAIIKYLNKIRLHWQGDKNEEDNLEIQRGRYDNGIY